MDTSFGDNTLSVHGKSTSKGCGGSGDSLSSLPMGVSEDDSLADVPRPRFEFPFKLHAILEDAAREGNDWIISWLSHGRAFKVHSRRDFEAYILPRYFGAPKFRSFQRQLAMYGFKLVRDRGSNDFRAYHNNLFVRGMPELCKEMMRHVKPPKKRSKKSRKKPIVSMVPSEFVTSSTNVVPPERPVEVTSTTPFYADSSYYGSEGFQGEPMTSSSQEDKDLLQFSIEANQFLEATSRKQESQLHKGVEEHSNLLPDRILQSSMACTKYNANSMRLSCSTGAEKLTLHPDFQSSNCLLPLFGWFADGQILQDQHVPTKEIISADELGKIGESLMSPDRSLHDSEME